MGRWTYPWFAVAVALSAGLLFCLEPLWARLVLPRFGGSAAVWSTLLVFYQALLLAGYAAAHGLTQRGPRVALTVWGTLAVVALALMPLAVPASGADAPSVPVSALLVESLPVVPPFLLLAMTGPLLQRQFSQVRPGADPYPLYAASNVGSILGLLSFPLAETHSGLGRIAVAWAAGLVVAVVLIAVAMARPAARASTGAPSPAVDEPASQPASPWSWFALALGPSAALVGLTTWLATAIASLPMLWVLPLLAYLLSFVVAFGRRKPSLAGTGRFAVLAMVPLSLALALDANHPTWAVLAVHLVGFFAVALACHRRLAALQPPVQHLTRYYLAQSVGGVVGGVAASLLAPLLCSGPTEYLLALVATLGLAFGWAPLRAAGSGLGAAVVPGAVALALSLAQPDLRTLGFSVGVLGAYLLSRQPARFVVGVGGVLLAAQLVPAPQSGEAIHTARGFYGIHAVTRDGPWVQLRHGVTVHGRQRADQREKCVPQLYYHRTGPIGQLLSELVLPATATVGAVGQGTGNLACYAKPGQAWTFFEIDPLVDAIARDPHWFTFLGRASVAATTVLGDARTQLQAWTGPKFDLLVLDAYSSDSIPIHLLTVEAMALYWRNAQPDAVLAFHVSNRYFDLPPVVGALAVDSNAVALVREDATLTDAERAEGKSESVWVAVARNPRRLDALRATGQWRAVTPAVRAWTDDRASALDVLDVR